MNLPNIFNFEQSILGDVYISELLQTNEETMKNGLILTVEDAKQILNVRNKALKGCGRIELGFDVTKKLVKVLSSSKFIDQYNYVSTVNDMQETFYYLKNETEDKMSDDALLEMMKDLFEYTCEGSMELLNSHLEEFSRDFRRKL